MRQGTERFLDAVEVLADDDFEEASCLPDWSCAHVVGHVARNAEALMRLASWARTGVESAMYESREQRKAEIESTAVVGSDALRRLLCNTAAELDRALDELDSVSWMSTVRSALGRTIPAAEIPWMRIREVWLHAIDIGANVNFSEFPPWVVDLLLDDTVSALSATDGCPSLLLAPDDRTQTWELGPESTETRVIDLPAAILAEWMTGRLSDSDRQSVLPEVPSWI
jgi:maleylpyruvate isomerase